MRTLALLSSLVFLAGCNCNAKIGDARPAHELAQYRPTSPDAKIDAVSFGETDRDTFDKDRVGTTLPATATHASVWYRWTGAETGRHIHVRWHDAQTNEVLHEQDEKLEAPFGETGWIFKTAAGGPLPAGSYYVEISENGTAVTKIPFTVGP